VSDPKRVHKLNRLYVNKLNVSKSKGVFGKGVSVWAHGGFEVAIMARNVSELREAFDKIKDDPAAEMDTKLIYDVVYLQSHHVTLEDEEL